MWSPPHPTLSPFCAWDTPPGPGAPVTELYQQLSPVRLRVQGCSAHSDGRSRAGQLMAGSEASGQDGPSMPLWSLPPEGDLNPVQWAYPKKPNSRQSSCKGCPLQCHSSQPEEFQKTSFPVPGYPSLPFQLSLCLSQALQGQPCPGEQAPLHLITGRAWGDEPGHGLKVPRTWGAGEFILPLSLHPAPSCQHHQGRGALLLGSAWRLRAQHPEDGKVRSGLPQWEKGSPVSRRAG